MSKVPSSEYERSKSVFPVQKHSGDGDNVGRDKITIQAISPAEIQDTIKRILTSLRRRQNTQAFEQLETIKTATSINNDTTGILDTLSILLDLSNLNPPSNAYQRLVNYHNTTSDALCIDIAISTLIRLDVKNESLKTAHDRYISKENPGVYTREVFYELLADEITINTTFESKMLYLDEIELCGLLRGALRLKIPEKALAIAEYLNSISPTFNSKTLLALSKFSIMISELEVNHYWRITATLRSNVLKLCDETVALLNECQGADNRILNLAVSLLDFVYSEYMPLADTCWKYISEIEEKFPDIAAQIRSMYGGRLDSINNITYKIAKAYADPSYKNEIINVITSCKEISVEDSTLLCAVADECRVKEWIGNGGTVSSEDQFLKDFSIFELTIIAKESNLKTNDDIRQLATIFIQSHNSRLKDLNPHRILYLANKLMELELPYFACELLKPHVTTYDSWVSPTLYSYLRALLYSQQMLTLKDILLKLKPDDWTAEIWLIKAFLFENMQEYGEAIEAVETSIKKNCLLPNGWNLLIDLHKKQGSDKKLIDKTLNLIPNEIFSEPSQFGFKLLIEIAIYGNFTNAERNLIKWFIENPVDYSIPFTNVYFSIIKENKTIRFSNTIDNCFGGVRYSKEGKIFTKLLVCDDLARHSDLLGISSPLGKLLFSMPLGCVEQIGVEDIKLLERLPPFQAALHIAISLRLAKNDGKDCFYSFELPTDPKEMFKILERKLLLLSSNNTQESLITDPQIPLFMKGHHLNQSSPVKSALYHLTAPKSFKHPLPAFGVENYDQIILDVYCVVYLSIAGLMQGIIDFPSRLIITSETKNFLEEWLIDINQPDYLTVGVYSEGGLYRNTAEEIQKQTSEFQKAVMSLIAKSEVIAPYLVDLPDKVLWLKDIVDLSVFSSLKLSIANNIPWLCIDNAFAQISTEMGYRTLNANQFFSIIGRGLPLEQKKQGLYLHVSAFLPYALTFEDMFQLSKSKENYAHYLLAKLIEMYPKTFSNTQLAIDFLTQVLSSILINAYSNGEILKGLKVENPQNNGHIEYVFNVCCFTSMQCYDGQEAEEKLASLLGRLLFIFRDIPVMNKLIQIMASGFITGHFMSFSAINRHITNVIRSIENTDQSNNDGFDLSC